MGVSVRGLHFEDAVFDREEGNIEGAAAKIENKHVSRLLCLLVESVGDGCCGGLADYSLDVKSGNGAGIFGGLPLRVIEVGGHGDNGVLDFLAKV